MPLLSKRKLVLTAQVACKLLISPSVGFATGCGSSEVTGKTGLQTFNKEQNSKFNHYGYGCVNRAYHMIVEGD